MAPSTPLPTSTQDCRRGSGGPARRRLLVAAVGALALLGSPGCKDKAAPEYVADQFVDAYFRRIDQASARQYTALGATEMLDRELESTRSIRQSGYTPDQAAAAVTFSRGPRTMRGERVRFDYAITIQGEGTESKRSADIELSKIQSAWKVVRVDVTGN